jgi:hypothetical protein
VVLPVLHTGRVGGRLLTVSRARVSRAQVSTDTLAITRRACVHHTSEGALRLSTTVVGTGRRYLHVPFLSHPPRTDSLAPVAYRFSRSPRVSSPRYLFSPTRTHCLVARGRPYLFSRSLVHGRPYFLTSHPNYCDSAHCGPDSGASSTSYPFSRTPEGIGTHSLTPAYRFSRTCVPFFSHPVPILSHPRTYSLTPLIG